MSGRTNPPIGVQCNAWGTLSQGTITPQATGANGFSAIVNTYNSPFLSAFGHVDAATTVNLQYSGDGVNFSTTHSVTTTGAADWNFDCICGAQYVRLQSTNAVNASGTVQAKGGGG